MSSVWRTVMGNGASARSSVWAGGRDPGWASCHRYHSRSIMAWWDQKTGSKPATGTADMLPPTHTWTSLWTFSNRKLKSLKVGARRMDRIVRSRGSSSGRSLSRTVRGWIVLGQRSWQPFPDQLQLGRRQDHLAVEQGVRPTGAYPPPTPTIPAGTNLSRSDRC